MTTEQIVGVLLMVLGICMAVYVVKIKPARRERVRSSAAEPAASEAPVQKCRHTSVPWPVMSGGDLVAWLCAECNEQRQVFKCPPPPKPKVLCSHEDMAEIRTMDNFTVSRHCQRCGYHDKVCDLDDFEFVAQPLMEGEKPMYDLRRRQQ